MDATLNKNLLKVSLTAVEGRREAPQRHLRIAFVRDGKIQYSAWQQGDTVSMKIRKK